MSEPIATFWPQVTPATAYWRCEVPARYMPADLADFDEKILVEGPPAMMERQRGRTAIWQFVARPQRLAAMQWQILRSDVRVLFECDDNYMLMPPHLPGQHRRTDFMRGIPAPNDPRSSVEVAKLAATAADGMLVSTRFLEKRYRRESNPYAFYCPNCVDLADWPTREDHHTDDVFRVGYVGSVSHFNDLNLITPALTWASKQDGVEVCTVGADHPSWTFKRRKLDLLPFEEFRQVYAAFDVVLCPIVPTEWSLSRSDNKVMESALGGAANIVSPGDVFQEFIDAGTVVVARQNKPRSFTQALQYLVKHRDEARDMAAKTRDHVEQHRTIQGNIWRWQEACEPRDRRRTRKKLMAWCSHNGMASPLLQSLADDGWEPATQPNHSDVCLMDYPIQGWGPRWDYAHSASKNGGVIVETPHGGIPMLTYDGGVEVHPSVSHSVVPARGWKRMYERMGVPFDVHVVGWSLCEVAEYQPLPKKVNRILFAPAHPNSGDGGKTILDWLREANETGYQRLLEHDGEKVVRWFGLPELNGLTSLSDPGVTYVKSDLRTESSVAMIDEADLVISFGTFASLALARGKPTIVLADPRPILDDGTWVANHHEDWCSLWAYPLKVHEAPSLSMLLDLYRKRERKVLEWRREFVGEQFDPAGFARLMDSLAYGAPDPADVRELMAA